MKPANQATQPNRQQIARFGLASQIQSGHRGRKGMIESIAHHDRLG